MTDNANGTQGNDRDATIAQLRAENDRLHSRLHDVEGVAAKREYRSTHRWRTALCAFLIVVGAALAPAALVAAWTATELTNTDRFVATMAPLAKNPQIRDYVTQQVTTAINKKVNIEQLTKDAFGALAGLGLPPQASSALQALAPAAAGGLEGLLNGAVSKVVSSEAFAQLWEQTLRTFHTQAANLLSSNPDGALAANSDGTIGLQLGPIIDQIKPKLEEAGFPSADKIPSTDATIALTTVKDINQMRSLYSFLVAFGNIFPWVSIVLLAAGVMVANRKARALIGASIATLIAMLLVILATVIGQAIFVASLSPNPLPGSVAGPIYDTVVTFVYSLAIAIGIVALIVGITGFVLGDSRGAHVLRTRLNKRFERIRHRLYIQGHFSRKIGTFVSRARIPLRVLIVIAGVAIMVLCRPLTPLLAITTSLGVLIVLAIEAALEYRQPTRSETHTGRAHT